MLYLDKYYHIYNHANGTENLFANEGNYHYFLKKYQQYINPVADTFAWCLMPNHFHALIKTKDLSGFENLIGLSTENLIGIDECEKKLNQSFSNFFNAYSKAFNKQQNRVGKLFRLPFKNKEVTSEEYFIKLVHYIHTNPVHHGFVKNMEDWKFSSYYDFLDSSRASFIKSTEVLEWYGSSDEFKLFHNQPIERKYILEMEF